MGISDWFRSRSTPSRPDDLLAALLDVFGRRDYEAAMHLINGNSERIKREFRSWTKPPESLRADADAVGRYAQTLMTIATVFEKSGDGSLRVLLEGGFAQWNEALERARQLTESGMAAEAVVLLRETLEDIATTSGPGTTPYRSRCLGSLGLALDKMGETSKAVHVTREALEACRQAGDEEGVKAYVQNLKAIGSWEVADARVGQRLKVVLTDMDGRTLLPEELPGTGQVTWQLCNATPAHPEAKRLHDEGRAAGEKGDHDAAITLFTSAADLDPTWPHPVYDRAFARLCKQDFNAALADYRKTLELSPLGYFTAAEAADMLSREAAGEFPAGLYYAFTMLEHGPPDEQRQIARQLVAQFPSHAPLWRLYASLLEGGADKLAAVESGLLARPDPDTRGSLLVQKALAFYASGEGERALEVLDPLTGPVADSLATQVQARIAAAVIRSGGPFLQPVPP
jgi:tetratricopeptide (TPR) repeat protein